MVYFPNQPNQSPVMQNPVSPAFHQESEILLRWRKSIVKRPQRQTVRHAQLFQRKDLGLRTAKSEAKVQEHVAVAVDQLVWRINKNSNCSASTATGQPAPGGKVFGATMTKVILPAQANNLCAETNNYKWFKSFCGSSHDTNWSWFPAKKVESWGEFSFTLPDIARQQVPQLPQCRQAISPASPQWTGFGQALQLPPETLWGFTHMPVKNCNALI